jgi:hypothetical protein
MSVSPNAFINGYMRGRKMKQEEDQLAQESEERKLRMAHLKHQMDAEKLADKLQAFKMQFGAKQGAPADIAPSIQSPELSLPNGVNIPRGFGSEAIPGGTLPHAAMNIPGTEMSVTPQTAEQMNMQKLMELMAQEEMKKKFAPPQVLPLGAKMIEDGQVIADNPKPAPLPSPDNSVTVFDLWRQQNPGRPAMDFLKEQAVASAGKASIPAPSDDSLVESIIENPVLFNQLSSKTKERVIPALNQRGFTAFGKNLSDGAIKEVTQSQSAVAALNDLRTTLVDNEQFIGPLAGMQAINPWSEGRQAQARIDAVRQRVGRALEGGVLRKEDEEKYKKILATLLDTPETAIFKVDGLMRDVQRDLDIYIKNQEQAGRNVPASSSEMPSVGGTFQGKKVLKVEKVN